jgi:hypothetical protein
MPYLFKNDETISKNISMPTLHYSVIPLKELSNRGQ